jgi:hypothetical protein
VRFKVPQNRLARSVAGCAPPMAGQPGADCPMSDLESVLACSADRETVLTAGRAWADQTAQLAAELHQDRKEGAHEEGRRELIPRQLGADRFARSDGQAIPWRAEAGELRRRLEAATAKSAELLCQGGGRRRR